MEISGRINIEYNFYYYTNEGQFRLNIKTFAMYGLVIITMLLIISVDYLFNSKMYVELAITTILFAGIIFLIRRLNK